MNKINNPPAAAAPTLGPAWAQVPAPLGQKPRNKNKISQHCSSPKNRNKFSFYALQKTALKLVLSTSIVAHQRKRKNRNKFSI